MLRENLRHPRTAVSLAPDVDFATWFDVATALYHVGAIKLAAFNKLVHALRAATLASRCPTYRYDPARPVSCASLEVGGKIFVPGRKEYIRAYKAAVYWARNRDVVFRGQVLPDHSGGYITRFR